MQVLWWLAPPLVATVLAMLWAAWFGRTRDEATRDNSDEALERMRAALARTLPSTARSTPPAKVEVTHGVAIRRTRPPSALDSR